MSKMMKALIKSKAEKGIWMTEVPIPEIGNNDVLIKVSKTAICGTDLHIYKWDEWSQKNIKIPTVTGHEFVGEIVKIGNDVKGFKVGDRVSGEGHITCGVCRCCRSGTAHLCQHTVGVGIHRNGCFAEYLAIPASNTIHIHPSISSELASIFDPFGNATHATLSFNLVGEDVLITGAGPIGIMAAAIARHCGARHIVVTDVLDYRLNLAKKSGATRVVNVAKESVESVVKELGMVGFDIGLEMSGNEVAFNSMVKNMHNSGRISLLGILPGSTKVPWDDIIFKGLFLKGIYGREIFETWYKMQSMLTSGLDISHVITHKFPFEQFQKGFDVMVSGECGKVILEF